MLTAADLAGLDYAGLIRRDVEMSARLGLGHRKCSRILGQKYAEPGADEHVIKAGDFPAIERSVTTMEEASRLLAENAEIMEAVRAFFADQNERRPAPVFHLVSRTEPSPVPAQPSGWRGWFAAFGSRLARAA